MLSVIQADLESIDLHVDYELIEKFSQLVKEHQKWNKVFNLSAHRADRDVQIYQLIDSLTVHNHIKTGPCLDIGTGPGFPGLPLAMLFSTVEFTLLDASQKKLAFIRHIKAMFNLDNVVVTHSRVEDYQRTTLFPQIISRAFSRLDNLLGMCEPLLAEHGRVLAMKGRQIDTEVSEIKNLNRAYKITIHELPHVIDESRVLAIAELDK